MIRKNGVYILLTIIAVVALYAFSYISAMNYCKNMEEQYVLSCGEQIANEISQSITYGKKLDNYYGLSELLEKGTNLLGENYWMIAVNKSGEYINSNQGNTQCTIDINEYSMLTQEIKSGDALEGYLEIYIPKAALKELSRACILRVSILCAGLLLLMLVAMLVVIEKRGNAGRLVFGIIIAGMILEGVICTSNYSILFMEYIQKNVGGMTSYLSESIEQMQRKGIEVSDISNLEEVFASVKRESPWIEQLSYDGELVYTVDRTYILRQVVDNVLSFIATIIIVALVMVEAFPISKMIDFRRDKNFNKRSKEQYAMSASVLRLTNFLTNTFSYICLSFAALQIKEWNVGCFGLSPGMSSALAVSLCTLAEAGGMILFPLLIPKISKKKEMIFSTALLIVANLMCFITRSSAVIVIMRLLAGFGFAGNKQVNNEFITSCYETPEEKEKNLAESNSGIIGGILCGLGLGSVLSSVFGYGATFFAAAVGSLIYLFVNLFFTPWHLLDVDKKENDQASVLDNLKNMGKVLISPTIWKYLIFIVAPQYFLIMIIVTLIPGRVQSAGMADNVLTYANLLNGIFGLYVGGYICTFFSKKIGKAKTLAITFAFGGLSIIMIDFPFPVLMLIISAIIAGLLDGVGTPLSTDVFLESKTLNAYVDESTGLMLYSIAGFLMMSIAPVVLEACEGSFVTATVCAGIFLLIGIVVFFSNWSKK